MDFQLEPDENSSSPALPVMFKGMGVLPQRAAGGGCLDTDTARTVVSSLSLASVAPLHFVFTKSDKI